jgi:hypothetical protein
MDLKHQGKETDTNAANVAAFLGKNGSVANQAGISVGRNRKILWRHFDFAVVACILVLAILLGVLNNLRVVGERKVKWFDAPAILDDLETTQEITP